MTHKISDGFCSCGQDTFICQACATERCADEVRPLWMKLVLKDGRSFNGNICPNCIESDKSWRSDLRNISIVHPTR